MVVLPCGLRPDSMDEPMAAVTPYPTGSPSVGWQTRRVARSFAEHDGPQEVADLLERLVLTGGPVPRAAADPWATTLASA